MYKHDNSCNELRIATRLAAEAVAAIGRGPVSFTQSEALGFLTEAAERWAKGALEAWTEDFQARPPEQRGMKRSNADIKLESRLNDAVHATRLAASAACAMHVGPASGQEFDDAAYLVGHAEEVAQAVYRLACLSASEVLHQPIAVVAKPSQITASPGSRHAHSAQANPSARKKRTPPKAKLGATPRLGTRSSVARDCRRSRAAAPPRRS